MSPKFNHFYVSKHSVWAVSLLPCVADCCCVLYTCTVCL